MRFANGGEEQEISEHKAVEKVIELSANVRKADSVRGGRHVKRKSADKQDSVASWVR